MKNIILITVLLLISSLAAAVPAQAANNKQRVFLFVGKPNAATLKKIMKNPSDHEAIISKTFMKLGGEMIVYCWGLRNGKNYITVLIPDETELVQVIYTARLGNKLLDGYEAIEQISGVDMSRALKRVKENKATDDIKDDIDIDSDLIEDARDDRYSIRDRHD